MDKFQSQQFTSNVERIFEIKHLQVGNEEALQNFQRQIAEETTHTFRCKEKETPLHKLKEAIERTCQSPAELFLGVFDQQILIGTLNFRIQMQDHPWIKHIGEFGMAILKDDWNQGIGKELLRIMEQFAASVGVSRIEAKYVAIMKEELLSTKVLDLKSKAYESKALGSMVDLKMNILLLSFCIQPHTHNGWVF